ncbi:hypothetical protein [Thalassobacter stenotrophicus]|uniref:hypothetical protein n=1 Tax=Thalassobacter stenotrophicus TaxID=266809 RepID=UPI000D5DEEE2|nr:hypothetical protein [Thalassobacter stenotrophicus]PVZ48729.1 hypothetical protein DD557_08290 [Thalassobacter stenotrophicus]
MANTVLLKRTTVAGRVPSTAQLAAGELAVNVTDGKLFLKRVSGAETVIELGQTGPQGPTGPAGVLRLAYGNLVGLLVEAIKDLAQEVDQLKRTAP